MYFILTYFKNRAGATEKGYLSIYLSLGKHQGQLHLGHPSAENKILLRKQVWGASTRPAEGTGVTAQGGAGPEIQSQRTGPSWPSVTSPVAAPEQGWAKRAAVSKALGDGEAPPYLGVVHEVIAAPEAVVELRHPPGSDDL